MADIIKFKKGLKATLPTLQTAEMAFVTDEQRLYLGTAAGNIKIPNMSDLNYLQSNVYGVRYEISTDTFIRLGSALGLSGGVNFDNIMPWAGMRRCNLADNLAINAYYGDYAYAEDGSNGQVMVEVPAFYYRRFFSDADHIDTLISMTPAADFKLHPWFYDKVGTVRAKAYFSAYEGSVYDVTTLATEVNTLTITAPCTANGNLTVTVDQFTIVVVPVLATDSTSALVAAKIQAAAYTGYTASIAGSVVTFTSNTTGMQSTVIVDTAATGVTTTIVKTTAGAGGYVKTDAQAVDFTASTGDRLCSIAGVKTMSGKTQAATIANCRKLANNRGTGWEQQHFIQMLLTTEYASLKSQSIIGQGVVNITDDGLTNCSVVTGATSTLGNKSGKAVGTDGLVSIAYRGVENFWGNIWKWVDGFNINNGLSYISNINGNFVSDVFTGQYMPTGFTNANTDGYISKVGINGNHDFGFIPTEVLGTSTSKYSDYFYRNNVGAFVAQLGGGWNDGAIAGAFGWVVAYGSGYANRNVGARGCA
jgi:hypothetical protein